MSYDHANKAGNQGDLVKHVALAQLAQDLSASETFVYAESHAGWPSYSLPTKGEWQHGVGRFDPARTLQSLAFASQYTQRFHSEATYLGSSALVAAVVARRQLEVAMHLWDTNRGVFDALKDHYKGQNVLVDNSDGVAGLKVLQKTGTRLSLVLIDPPDLPEGLINFLNSVTKANWPFLCWTPLTSRSGDEHRSAAEAARSAEFTRAAVEQRYGVVRVHWYKWGHRTPGCQLTMSRELLTIVQPTLLDGLRGLNWTVETFGD